MLADGAQSLAYTALIVILLFLEELHFVQIS